MADRDTVAPSVSVGDYLKAVWDITGATGRVAGTKEVAVRLSVSPASVTNMFVRMQEMGLVGYERYRGVSLTDLGRGEALRLVRRHRLIETFLMEHLGYDRGGVHEEAEKLEHAVSDAFTERLAEFLGHPELDPHGHPIPTADGALAAEYSFPLGEAGPGELVRVAKVVDDAGILGHLEGRGIVPGCVVEVIEAREIDGVVTVRDEDGRLHALGEVLARAVSVRGEPTA